MLTILSLIGALFLFYGIANSIHSIYIYFIRSPKNVCQYGSWAIVTGATDGIGRAMAEELSRKGMNLLLLSRNTAKLNKVAEDIQAKSKVLVKTHSVDFNCIEDASVLEDLRKIIFDIGDVGVLINNVGVSYAFPQFYNELSTESLLSMVHVNILSTSILIKFVLPGMRDRERGVIVNVSSASARLCVPLLSAYSASKRYVEQLSECISYENQDKNIHVQCHNPMFVATKLAKIRSISFFVPSPETYAKAAVRQIGYERVISPYWPHALQLWLYEHLPTAFIAKIAAYQHCAIRKRAMEKCGKKVH